jgi:hypothetical protein
VSINVIHFAANKGLDIYLDKDYKQLTVRHHMERLKEHIHKA